MHQANLPNQTMLDSETHESYYSEPEELTTLNGFGTTDNDTKVGSYRIYSPRAGLSEAVPGPDSSEGLTAELASSKPPTDTEIP